MKVICFIHSCNLPLHGTSVVKYLIKYLIDSPLYPILDHIFVNNIGTPIVSEDLFQDLSEDLSKVRICNYSTDGKLFEPATLRVMKAYSLLEDAKILYIHTKTISHTPNSTFFHNSTDWMNFMLYVLVNHSSTCLELLNHVDTVGCNYKHRIFGNPSHFSGNFWWVNSQYLRTLDVSTANDKYSVEMGLFANNPTFLNLFSSYKHHYQESCPKEYYASAVDNKLPRLLETINNIQNERIYYGIPEHYADITEICSQKCIDEKGYLHIPVGDHERNELFGDPLPGTVKHIKIGAIILPFIENLYLRMG